MYEGHAAFHVPADEAAALKEQDRLRRTVEPHGPLPRPLRYVAGLDVAYATDESRVAGAVAVLDVRTLEVVDSATAHRPVEFPYVPGLLAFREIPALLDALAQLTVTPDVLVCDGYGLAHPRRFGLACHLGVLTGIPTFGVAKTPFIGTFAEPGRERGAASDLLAPAPAPAATCTTTPTTATAAPTSTSAPIPSSAPHSPSFPLSESSAAIPSNPPLGPSTPIPSAGPLSASSTPSESSLLFMPSVPIIVPTPSASSLPPSTPHPSFSPATPSSPTPPEIIGRVLRTQTGIKPVFISVGHRIGLDEATSLTLRLAPSSPGFRLPETTRRSDQLSRQALAES